MSLCQLSVLQRLRVSVHGSSDEPFVLKPEKHRQGPSNDCGPKWLDYVWRRGMNESRMSPHRWGFLTLKGCVEPF